MIVRAFDAIKHTFVVVEIVSPGQGRVRDDIAVSDDMPIFEGFDRNGNVKVRVI
jgi:hypothetical protein